MHIHSICVVSDTYGTISITFADGSKLDLKLSEPQCQQIMSMAHQFYSERQQEFSNLVLEPVPLLADFSEVD